jgi:hypothetical protein
MQKILFGSYLVDLKQNSPQITQIFTDNDKKSGLTPALAQQVQVSVKSVAKIFSNTLRGHYQNLA